MLVRSLVRELRSPILYGHSSKNQNNKKKTFSLFVKLLNVFIHQVEKALLQTSLERSGILGHTHWVSYWTSGFSTTPMCRRNNMKGRTVGQKVSAVCSEHQSSSRISPESVFFFKWGPGIQGCVGVMRRQSPDQGRKHTRQAGSPILPTHATAISNFMELFLASLCISLPTLSTISITHSPCSLPTQPTVGRTHG